MCLYAVGNLITVYTPLEVYKILTLGNYSPFKYFKYEPNKLYRLRQKLVKNERRQVEEGFHAFLTFNAAQKYGVALSEKIVKMVIPKGAKVYYGGCGDIVSTSIKSESLKSYR